MLLHIQRATGESRFPEYDNIGTVRGLLDDSGTVTDTYQLDTFGRRVSSSGTTPNPYKFGGAWGYITDPSGLLQLGARYYWPELGRFVSEDPSRHRIDWYTYADNNPLTKIDPQGLQDTNPIWTGAFDTLLCYGGCVLRYGGFGSFSGWLTKIACEACIAAPNPLTCGGCIAGLVVTLWQVYDFKKCLDDCKNKCHLPDPNTLYQG